MSRALGERRLRVAVVGATGAVGRALVQALDDSDLPIQALRLFASERSAGSELEFRGESLSVEALGVPAAAPRPAGAGLAVNGAGVPAAEEGPFAGQDLAFFAAGPACSRAWLEHARAARCGVIDLGPAFRDDPEIPMVLSEVNPEAIAGFARRGVVATPGAAASQLVLALHPLHRAAGLERIAVTTLGPASAGGQRGVDALEAELRAMLSFAEPPAPTAFPHRLAFNVVPQAGSFDAAGVAEEERTLAAEARRLLGSSVSIVATQLQIPIFHGSVQVVGLRTRRPLRAAEAREVLRGAPGVKLLDAPAEGIYPMPMLAVNDDSVLVGRVRDDLTQENGLQLLVTGDNLRRGAATAAVGAARLLLGRGLLGA